MTSHWPVRVVTDPVVTDPSSLIRSSLSGSPGRPRVATVGAGEHPHVGGGDEPAVRTFLQGVDAQPVETIVEDGPGSSAVGAAEELPAGPEEEPIAVIPFKE